MVKERIQLNRTREMLIHRGHADLKAEGRHFPGAIELDSFFDHLPKGICGTGDSFETGISKVTCNLVDMEGYALAKVCKKLGVRLISVKYITDGANETAHLDWEENLLLGAKKLLDLYQMVK